MDSSSSYFTRLLSFVIILALSSGSGYSVRLELTSGLSKCISEDIKSEYISVGKYTVVNPIDNQPLPDSHKITARIIFPRTDKYHHHLAEQVTEGKFSFHAVETGLHYACFTAVPHEPPTTVAVDFEWNSGIAATDWSSVAKKGSVDAMEFQLKQLFEVVQNIEAEMLYLRTREEEMRLLNTETNSIISYMSFGSIIMCLAVAGVQFKFLKTFFEKKKII